MPILLLSYLSKDDLFLLCLSKEGPLLSCVPKKVTKEGHPVSGLSGTGFAPECDQTPHPKGSLHSDRFFVVFAQPVLDTLRSKGFLLQLYSLTLFSSSLRSKGEYALKGEFLERELFFDGGFQVAEFFAGWGIHFEVGELAFHILNISS